MKIVLKEKNFFAPRSDPTESTGPFQSEKDLIFSYLKGEKPTLLFKNGDYVGGHKVNLIDLFPIVFLMVLVDLMKLEQRLCLQVQFFAIIVVLLYHKCRMHNFY